MRPQPDAPAGTGGELSFVHKGQDKIDPAFSAILVDTSMGRNFTITPGYRFHIRSRRESRSPASTRTVPLSIFRCAA